MSALYVLNFYSPVFVDQLKRGRKTATIRLGDKTRKYDRGQVVWITVGYRHGPREKIFSAVIDDVEVKRVADLSPRDIEHDNPEFRRLEDTVNFLEQIYSRSIDPDDVVTVIRFSQIVERPQANFGNGETPSQNWTGGARRDGDGGLRIPDRLAAGRPARGRLGRDLGLGRVAGLVARRRRGGRDRPRDARAASAAAAATPGGAGSRIRSASRSSRRRSSGRTLLVGRGERRARGDRPLAASSSDDGVDRRRLRVERPDDEAVDERGRPARRAGLPLEPRPGHALGRQGLARHLGCRLLASS